MIKILEGFVSEFLRMSETTEGCFYICCALCCLMPFAAALYLLCKRVVFKTAFLFFASIMHVVLWILMLIGCYQSTTVGVPNYIYAFFAFTINLTLALFIYQGKSAPQSNKSWLKKISNLIAGAFASLVVFVIGFVSLAAYFVFAPSYHIKTGQKAWLTENDIRTKVGKNILPSFSYVKAKPYHRKWNKLTAKLKKK